LLSPDFELKGFASPTLCVLAKHIPTSSAILKNSAVRTHEET